MKQSGLGSGVGVVLLLVRAVALSASPDDLPVLIALEVDCALAVGEGAGGELLDQAFIVAAQALEHRRERLEACGGDHVGRVLTGFRNTGTMILAPFVLPSLLSRSARPMFCTISTWEPRVSAKQTASTPRSPVMSTPSPSTRTLARKARWTWRPAASMPLANWRSTSRRSVTRWSPQSHADHTRSGGTWRPASSADSHVRAARDSHLYVS